MRIMKKNLLKLDRESYLEIGKTSILMAEAIKMLNYLIENRVITHNKVIEGFKENMETIAILLNRVLRDGNEEFSISFNNIEKESFDELSMEELKEFRDDSIHINNKKTSRKYRRLLKDNIALLFDKLKNVSLEDLALAYNMRIYPLEELEDIYKYI
jgi:hypothetical protein